MPKVFSDEDRQAIRRSLVEHGRDRFLRFGLRKTSVDELARACGIAKGTFYGFFASKEDLCMAIFNEEEERAAGRVQELIARNHDPETMFEAVMSYALRVVGEDSLLMRLRETGEYSLLTRGVGNQTLTEHQENDVPMAAGLLETARQRGASPAVEPEVFAGVLRAIAMLSLHGREIGEDVFDQAMAFIVRAIASHAVGRSKREEQRE